MSPRQGLWALALGGGVGNLVALTQAVADGVSTTSADVALQTLSATACFAFAVVLWRTRRVSQHRQSRHEHDR